ncbi:MAG: TetR/AcrR family transcriptional regulator [Maritimibacter sp.]|nr:TetR/AcrR family transcriptional regulator [Maritimibacter sp.]
MSDEGSDDAISGARDARPIRADAKRNEGRLIDAARVVFARAGVDAPMREIADEAGVGVGTLYRRFPQRADLIAAVFRLEVDACAEAAKACARDYGPADAVDRWMQRYVDFILAKRGLAASLHSGGPAYANLPAYFDAHLEPALTSLLDAAIRAGEIRAAIPARDLLRAVAGLCLPSGDGDPEQARRLVRLLVQGLRYQAAAPSAAGE